MAAIQGRYKWMTLFLPVLATAVIRLVTGCHPASKELHICLNIYLERDFPLIETIVKGQGDGRTGRRRVILEGPDLYNICKHIGSLKDCYSNLLPECTTMWQYDRYMRVMDVLGATHDHLCLNNTNNVKDLLLNSGCLTRSQTLIADCTGFDWSMSWRKILRMQTSPQDSCKKLESYRQCLKDRLLNVVCGKDASDVYQKLMEVWLKHWCAKNSTPEEDRRYFYLSLNNV